MRIKILEILKLLEVKRNTYILSLLPINIQSCQSNDFSTNQNTLILKKNVLLIRNIGFQVCGCFWKGIRMSTECKGLNIWEKCYFINDERTLTAIHFNPARVSFVAGSLLSLLEVSMKSSNRQLAWRGFFKGFFINGCEK